jgi:hypothetical protein
MLFIYSDLSLSESIFFFFPLSCTLFIYIFYFIIFTLTHMSIHCLGPPPLSPLSPAPPLLPSRTCSALFFSDFVENTRDNKKDIAVLLVWDKDSYTERFLVLLPCTCVLQSTLVHLCQTSSPLPSPLAIVASTSLRLLYSILCSEHINHIQILGFLPFPYPSHVRSPLTVTHV